MFQDVIFGYKQDLQDDTNKGREELFTYLSSLSSGSEYVGILTDGLIFNAYVLEELTNDLRKIGSINLKTVTASDTYLWFEAYFLRQNNVEPTSADIVRRFGLDSPIFQVAARTLYKMLKILEITEAGTLEVKQHQWALHLARVYGSANVTSSELFIRHTYLCQFAKLLVYASRFGIEKTKKEIENIINGTAFEILGVNNIGEQDFFAWVLAETTKYETLKVFQKVVTSLKVYDLHKINEDLLKQLYQNLVEPETRHNLGEFYTPDWLAEMTLREINYQKGQSLLDPACGSGTFLFTAIRLLHEQGMEGEALVDFALKHIRGIDVHPLAVTIARINYMLALLPHMRITRNKRTIPVSMANALQVSAKEYLIDVIDVPIEPYRKISDTSRSGTSSR